MTLPKSRQYLSKGNDEIGLLLICTVCRRETRILVKAGSGRPIKTERVCVNCRRIRKHEIHDDRMRQ